MNTEVGYHTVEGSSIVRFRFDRDHGLHSRLVINKYEHLFGASSNRARVVLVIHVHNFPELQLGLIIALDWLYAQLTANSLSCEAAGVQLVTRLITKG